ncbi:MAG: transglutaminase family protein [Gammaproteobacteria bacterium]|nr:transglutaminase family protein [Gammaproteobacteria bacterium]
MRYKIQHITKYSYQQRVSHCYNLACMSPRNTPRQRCLNSTITLNPTSASSSKRTDYFGNESFHFEIQRAHKQLTINIVSTVETDPQLTVQGLDFGTSCKEVKDQIEGSSNKEILLAREFLLDSPMIKNTGFLKDYAAPSFSDDTPLLASVRSLTNRIFNDFTYCPEATTIATPLTEVFETKKGVCQDFAHLLIACLRVMGFPAKYVSGYIETISPPGVERLIGADATHAWISVFSPAEGWVEFDPTNDTIATEQHIITAWGRDYFDVTPLKGVVFGGGEDPNLSVSVDVKRIE